MSSFFSFLDLYGYVIKVSEEIIGKSGNAYFNITVKTSPSDQQTVRIMKNANPSIKRDVFIARINKPIHLGNVSKGGDAYFFNKYRGSFYEESNVSFSIEDFQISSLQEVKNNEKEFYDVKGKIKWSSDEQMKMKKDGSNERLREGTIVDESRNSVPLSIWGKSIDSINDGKVHIFTHLQVKFYYGIKKLTTTKATVIIVTKDDFQIDMESIESVDWKKIEDEEKKKSFPIINNAVIIGCDIDMYPKCTNKRCQRKITPPQGQERFSCQCGRRLDKLLYPN